jgi:hypothetical protein
MDKDIFSNNIVIRKLTELHQCRECELRRERWKEWIGRYWNALQKWFARF